MHGPMNGKQTVKFQLSNVIAVMRVGFATHFCTIDKLKPGLIRYEKSQGNDVKFVKACVIIVLDLPFFCYSAVRSMQFAKLRQVTQLCTESDSCLLDRARFLIVGICHRTLWDFPLYHFFFLK